MEDATSSSEDSGDSTRQRERVYDDEDDDGRLTLILALGVSRFGGAEWDISYRSRPVLLEVLGSPLPRSLCSGMIPHRQSR